jgi:competence ComEA-like helix-hairpin-helix protein
MKVWWKDFVKHYLSFSAKDRRALMLLLVGILLVIVLPYFFSKPKKLPAEQINTLNEKAAAIKKQQSVVPPKRTYGNNDDDDFQPYQPSKKHFDAMAKGELFAFDPNTLDAAGWKRLGLKDKTITTIQNFLAKGYRFKKPEDLAKIYGLKQEQADRLMPYVQIAPPTYATEKATTATSASTEKKPYAPKTVDINKSDTTAWIALPGIGSKLAFRIVNFRDKLGGFISVEQVAETFGLADSTFQKIKPRLVFSTVAVRKININTADANQLNHPYIRWNIANAIIQYRQQHGQYKSVADLKKIMIIDDALLQKITPYLTVE